ncbi:MAG: ATP-binding protein, partial [Hymenobacter sp.]
QAVNNLISNAIKFTRDGSSITLSLEERPEKVMIIVSDNGIGIPERFHAALFDKFSPAGRTGLNGEPSVGLGMSIIKTIVEWHEGRIWFESEETKGTTFYIEIAKSS